jgi:dynein heavy chain 1
MGNLDLCLNFSEQLFHIFKETNNLKRLGFRQIFSITLRAQDMQYMYPIALSLQDSLRTFNYINTKVTDKFELLIAKVKMNT